MSLSSSTELTATLVRCAAPSKRFKDGRCPNRVSAHTRDDAIYCSKRCKQRAYQQRRRTRRSLTPAERVLAKVQAARQEAGLPALKIHPLLQALARHRAAAKLLDAALESHPDYRPTPRYLGVTVPEEDLDALRLVALEGSQAGVEVLPVAKGRYLVVIALA